MNEPINFKKQRELGSILTDTFKFIRQEGKSLFGMILKIAGPALLIVIVAYVYYMQTALGSFFAGSGNLFAYNDLEPFGFEFFTGLLLMYGSLLIFYPLLFGTIIGYIDSYVRNDGVVVKEEVMDLIRTRFWGLMGLNLLMVIMVFIGFMLCGIPGIYLSVVLPAAFSIFVIEKRDITDSISYSFELIKGQWWITFATLIVVWLLYYFIMIIMKIPEIIYSMIKTFTMVQEQSPNPAAMFDWTYTTLSAVGMIAQYLLQSILVISTVFIYFNLNEKKNFTGTMETIEALGKRDELNG